MEEETMKTKKLLGMFLALTMIFSMVIICCIFLHFYPCYVLVSAIINLFSLSNTVTLLILVLPLDCTSVSFLYSYFSCSQFLDRMLSYILSSL